MIRLLGAAVILASGVLVLRATLGQGPGRRNLEYAPDMAYSAAYRTQSPNPFLPRGRTQQPPVPGTIARGAMPIDYGPSVRDFVRAGEELVSPYREATPADMDRARAVYRTFCFVCHGESGAGDGPVARRGYPRPPSLLFGKALNMKDGHIFHIITHGLRNMPSYASQIEVDERWLAVAWVRWLQGEAP